MNKIEKNDLENILKKININKISNKKLNLIPKIEDSLKSTNAIIVRALASIIARGVFLGASDIHIEPFEKETNIRYRIDGILHNDLKFNKEIHEQIISRLKVISELDLTNFRTPQDGKFRREINGEIIDFRVSIIPLVTGEKAAIRILNKEQVNFNLENLGFSSMDLEKIQRLIHKKSGIILASGPTGSGKTSLLYSILKEINSPELNISTVEDPVEYEIEGINQVQITKDVIDFSSILKAFLRQDPDVLMIGEIRDNDTAEIAIKAALTGHLVLSSLHTNDAISGISRLLNIGIKNYEIADTVIAIIAQRLVRKLCPKCKIKDDKYLGKLSYFGVDIKKYENIDFYTSCGCEYCNHSGYIGRMPLFQIFEIDENIQKMIIQNKSLQEITTYCKNNNYKELFLDGIEKATLGLTSLEEILRVC